MKEETGPWRALRLAVEDQEGRSVGGAQVLVRKLPLPFRAMAYVPRGPFAVPGNESGVADEVVEYLRNHEKLVSVTFEPDLEASADFRVTGGTSATMRILLPSTIVLDLTQDSKELLSQMAKKTRSYVRRSLREGTLVREAVSDADLEQCLNIYEQTAARAGFALHSRDYYRAVHREMRGQAAIYVADFEGVPVAFLWLIYSGHVSVELYGGATEVGLRTRANYGLKWEAIQDQRARGVREYDLNGLLDAAITQFKKGFSDHVDDLHGAVEVPLSFLYPVWASALPHVRSTVGKVKEFSASRRGRD